MVHWKEAVEHINANWMGLWQADKAKGKRSGVVCPLCGSGSGSKGTGIKEDTRETHAGKHFLHCYNIGCGFSGTAVQLLGRELGKPEPLRGADFREVMEEAAKRLHFFIEWDDKGAGLKAPAQVVKQEKTVAKVQEESKQDFSGFCEAKRGGLKDSRAAEYLGKRGFNVETAARVGIGFDAAWTNPKGNGKYTSPRMIIPFAGGCGYLARGLTDGNGAKQNVGEVSIFNPAALSGEVVFICEGWADALSVESCGYHAISLNGCANYGVLKAAAADFCGAFVIAFDNDANGAGQAAAAKAKEFLDENNFFSVVADLSGGKVGQDANDFFVADRQGFEVCLLMAAEDAKAAFRRWKKPDSLLEYVESGNFERDTKYSVCVPSGFPAFDAWLDDGIFSGRLYVFAGRTGLGKSALLFQIGENIAAAGIDVLYFSLELSGTEILSRAYVRHAFKRGRELSLNKVMNGRQDASEAKRDFFSVVGDRLSVIDKGFVEDVASIRKYVEGFKARNKSNVVVIVDYLQATAANDGKAENTAIADAAKGLKQLAKDCACPVLTASSMARTTYNDSVSFSSFYGSSIVEFTADCVVGLQYAVIDSPAWYDFPMSAKEADKKEKRAKLLDAAEAENPRRIYICGLKYRGNCPKVRIPILFDSRNFDISEAEKPFVFKVSGNNNTLSSKQVRDLCDDGKPAP